MPRTIHRKKLFGGQMTAEEYHSKYGFPPHARCQMCPARPVIRAIVMMEMSEARKNPLIDQLMLVRPEAILENIVQIKGSDGRAVPYFRCSVVYSCKRCEKDFSKALAKAPSHAIVEINRGPGPDKIISNASLH